MNGPDTIDVICVDDDVSFLQMEKEFLDRCGFISVDVATSVADASNMIAEKRYEVVVSDYQMPGHNGIDLLKLIRSRDDVLPFILFTGHGEEQTAIEALSEGATFYLEKGGDVQLQFVELINMIRSCAEHVRLHGDDRSAACTSSQVRRIPDKRVVLSVDRNGRITDCSRDIGSALGYARDELIGRAASEIVQLSDSHAPSGCGISDLYLHPSARAIRVVRKDGVAIDAFLSSAAFGSGRASRLARAIWVVTFVSQIDE